MSLREERNKQAILLRDLLFCCELKALLGNNTVAERESFLKSCINTYKNAAWLNKSLRRILRGAYIEDFINIVLTEGYSQNCK